MVMLVLVLKLVEVWFVIVEVSSGVVSVFFYIFVLVILNSDGSVQKVIIVCLEMLVKLCYLVVLVLCEIVYLEVEICNDSDYLLFFGILNIFFGNSFVVSGYLCGVMFGESFELVLGVDEGIGIECKLVKCYIDSSGLIGNCMWVNYEFCIDVCNNYKNVECVQFEDQLLVLCNEQIQVILLEFKVQEVKYEDDGKLKWDWIL